MEKLNIDIGLKSYELVEGGKPLTFNPSDPNVYARFVSAMDDLKKVEQEMAEKAKAVDGKDEDKGAAVLEIMHETDKRMKLVLTNVFGDTNDFNAILCGVNLMAVAEDGERIISKVLDALSPIMESGAKTIVSAEVKAAKLNREQRRALGV